MRTGPIRAISGPLRGAAGRGEEEVMASPRGRPWPALLPAQYVSLPGMPFGRGAGSGHRHRRPPTPQISRFFHFRGLATPRSPPLAAPSAALGGPAAATQPLGSGESGFLPGGGRPGNGDMRHPAGREATPGAQASVLRWVGGQTFQPCYRSTYYRISKEAPWPIQRTM